MLAIIPNLGASKGVIMNIKILIIFFVSIGLFIFLWYCNSTIPYNPNKVDCNKTERILIVGGPGSGKSFAAQQLGKKLNLPVYCLDDYFYDSDWRPVPEEQFVAKQRELIAKDVWIIDGTSTSTLSERLKRADLIIFFDVPLYMRVWSIIKRDFLSTNPHLPAGCTFSYRQFWYFLIKNVVGFSTKQKAKKIYEIIAHHPEVPAVIIRSREEWKRWLLIT